VSPLNVWVYGFHAEADESAIAKEAVAATAVISASPRGRRHDGGAAAALGMVVH